MIGIGDRIIGRTNTTPTPTEIFLSVTSNITPDPVSPDAEKALTQTDLLNIRNAVQSFMETYTLQNPTATDDELTAAIDSEFAAGLSDIFNIRQENLGASQTVIKGTQIEL